MKRFSRKQEQYLQLKNGLDVFMGIAGTIILLTAELGISATMFTVNRRISSNILSERS